MLSRAQRSDGCPWRPPRCVLWGGDGSGVLLPAGIGISWKTSTLQAQEED